ncbi:MAG: NYN domain-containing protein [Actinomycetota bacterium]
MVATKSKVDARSVPTHVIVDGSNLATEGRSTPSLKQLNEAVLAFMKEFPKAQVTVVVDASFGHRIDKKEAGEFSEAIANGELVTPPAGAVGRGDGFVLMIADKVNATVLSNDSYQEFHDHYKWLFDAGRLMGGKPVPHVGWIFVDRLPVRAMTETRIHHHRDLRLRKLLHERKHGLVELLEAWCAATLGRKVAAIHDHVCWHRPGVDLRLRGYHAAKVAFIKSASSWSCTALEPVAGLPEPIRVTLRKS